NAIQYIMNEGWHPRNVDSNVSWSFAESPSHFLKRFYPSSRNMHTFDKYGTTNSIGSDFLNNANSSNNSVKELNYNLYNIEINIDTDNFVAESEIALSINRDYMLQLVNDARSNSGAPPLKMDSRLNGVAQHHSEYMRRVDTLTHDDEDGDFPTRVTETGYDWNALGENIASGFPNEDADF
ncbi:2362_t:CDS:2, partial [Racocetra persica]